MIWVSGEIVEDDEFGISVQDRTFEHGLGLFETLRTWNGHPTLLDRHLERLMRSARELGLTLDPESLPDPEAVSRLLVAEGIRDDAALRITASGGVGPDGPSVVWMRTRPLPSPTREGTSLLIDEPLANPCDPLARHKTLNYWSRRLAYERAGALADRETLLVGPDGRIWEGVRTNLFALIDSVLRTPGLDGPVLPGIMRGVVLERAVRLGLPCREEDLTPESVLSASEVFLTNSVRGIIPVASFEDRDFELPGPCTEGLWRDVSDWLNRGGIDP